MLIATVTVGGVCYVILLALAILVTCMAFSHYVGCGGIFGWWMANQMMELVSVLLKALFEAIASMRD
jgi:hypothetical protein